MKKILICLLVCLIALPMHAEDPTVTINGVVYEYNFTYTIHEETAPGTNTYSFSGWARVKDGQDAEGDVEIVDAIPVVVDNVTGKTENIHISSIVSGAFDNNTKITSVFIPDGVWLSGGFYGCTSLKSVSLPGGINIPDRCFSGCTNLETVTFRGGINKIGTDSFRSCTSLKSIDLSKGVKELGRSFYLCSGLKSVTLPETGLTSIGECCFEATAIEYLNIPASVTSISSSICKNCKSLKEVVIPNCNSISGQSHFLNCTSLTKVTVTGEFEMPNYMFCGCSSLKTVILNKVKTIGYQGFYGCTSLESITIPNTVTRIGINAFEGCTALKSIDIPNSVTVINGSAFSGCSTLSSVTLPSALTELDGSAFRNCTSLVSIALPASITELGTNELFYGCTNLKSVTLCQSNRIGNNMFQNCKSLKSITIPNTVKIICGEAFKGCTALKSITIPNSVTEIQARAFENCSSLRRVELSSNLENMASSGGSVFQNCTSLLSLTFPSTMKELGTGVFNNCTSLILIDLRASTKLNITSKDRNNGYFMGVPESTVILLPGEIVSEDEIPNIQDDEEAIEFADSNVKAICIANWDTNGDGELSLAEAAAVTDLGTVFKNERSITSFEELQFFTGLTSIDRSAFYYCSTLTTVIIPNGVTEIGYGAFQGCSSLTSVTIPSSVIEIGDYAFENCRISTITIPGTVKDIGQSAFENAGLTSITLEEGIQSIGYMAFARCGFTTIHIPSSVNSIGSGVEIQTPFLYCQNLSSITVAEGNEYYDSRDNCNAIIRKSDNRLIAGCKSTIIPSSVKIIGSSAFHTQICKTSSEDKIVENLIIPEGVTTIESMAFAYTGIRSVSISSSVTSIGEYAFDQCTFLSTVRVERTSPPATSSHAFWTRPITKLYVPSGCSAAYQAKYPWNEMGEIIEYDEEEDEEIIEFVDANVKKLCVQNWDTNDDGKLSKEEAAAVTDLGEVFKGNNTITSFDELQYFTGLTSIPDRAFDNCKNLTSLRLPESITTIGMGAFLHCDLQSIYIPASVEDIGIYPFVHNNNLTFIQVDAANTRYDSRNECNAIIETSSNTLIQGCKTTVIPSGIKKIGNFAFEFVDLSHIDLPQSLEEISWNAFYGCANLDEVVFPDGLKSIARFAYNGCVNFKSIVLPASLSYMGGASFAGCYNIETLSVAPGGETYISPDGSNAIVSKDGTTLVAGCKNTVIPESVVTIGSECFYDQKNLTKISIPASVKTIEDHAFCGCIHLTEVDIPKDVETIGDNAFNGCQTVSVTIRREQPITITANVFTDRASSTLYVPKGSKAAYEAADYWKNFREIVELEDAESYAVLTDDNRTLTFYYDNQKTSRNGIDVNHGWNQQAGLVTTVVFDDSFANCTTITSTANWFSGCTNLTEIIGIKNLKTENVTDMSGMFSGCSSLTSIDVSNFNTEKVTDLSNMFYDCATLATIDVSNFNTSKVTNMYRMFNGCKTLTTIYGSNWDTQNVTKSTLMFFRCEKLVGGVGTAYAELSDGLKHGGCLYARIDGGAGAPGFFTEKGQTNSDNNIIIFADANVKAICVQNWDKNGDGELSKEEAVAVKDFGEVFMENEDILSFDELQYFTGVTSIGNNAFYGCTGLTSIILPNTVTSIGGEAFSGCNIASLTIPSSVTRIDQSFEWCTSLTTIIVEEGNTVYDSRDNCNAIIHKASNMLILGCKSTVIPSSVKTIGGGAFLGCTGLTSLTIPSSVTCIGCAAFGDCTGLKSLIIPSNVTDIDPLAFRGCRAITSVIVEDGNSVYDSRNNCNAIIRRADNTLVAGFKSTIIPSSVMTIGEESFYGCDVLMSLTIPSSVTRIEGYAFYGCSSLQSLTIPKSVTSIGSFAFEGCKSMSSITIPNSVTSIGDWAFWNCKLKSVTVEWGEPIAIDESVFPDRENTTLFVPHGSMTAYEAAEVWKDFGVIRESRYVIMKDDIIFEKREDGTATATDGEPDDDGTLEIPAEVQADEAGIVVPVIGITDGAFMNNSLIMAVGIPESVQLIGMGAFAGCENLKDIYVYGQTPATIANAAAVRSVARKADGTAVRAFEGVDKETCVLHVPYGTAEQYRQADGWCEFTHVVEMAPTSVSTIGIGDTKADVYDMNGRKVRRQATTLEDLPKGVYIVNGRKVVLK